MVKGEMQTDGLCSAANFDIIDRRILELFTPTEEDMEQLVEERQMPFGSNPDYSYWASGLTIDHPRRVKGFTELRQTIILFMAAINNEL